MIGALATMAAGGLIQGISNYQAGKATERSSAKEAARQEGLINKVEGSLKEGSSTMMDSVGRDITSAQNDPLYNAYYMRNLDSIGKNSALGSSLYGAGTSTSDALAKTYGGVSPQQVNAYKYDPTQATTNLGAVTTAGQTRIGRDMQAANLGDSDAATLQQQQALRDQMQKRAFGLVPSIAQQQYAGALDQAQARQAGLAAATRGGANALLAQRQAQMMGNQAMQDSARESAAMAMQERERAETAYGGMMQGMRADTTQRDITQAGFEQQANQANLNKLIRQAELEAARKQFNAGALTQGSQFNASALNQGSQFNAGAANDAARDYVQQLYGASNVNAANQLSADQFKATGLSNALSNELGQRIGIEQFNIGNRQNTSNLNANYLSELLGEKRGYESKGAFAGAESAKAGLGVDLTVQPAPTIGQSIMNAAAPMVQQAGSNWLSTYMGGGNAGGSQGGAK